VIYYNAGNIVLWKDKDPLCSQGICYFRNDYARYEQIPLALIIICEKYLIIKKAHYFVSHNLDANFWR
jgi:hypothetical protein